MKVTSSDDITRNVTSVGLGMAKAPKPKESALK